MSSSSDDEPIAVSMELELGNVPQLNLDVPLDEEDEVFFNVDSVNPDSESKLTLMYSNYSSALIMVLPGYLSSSGYEDEEEEIMNPPHVQLPNKKNEQVYALVQWFIIFVRPCSASQMLP